uniref:Uncharacterized protein n=1 Tax=Octopus bimaculoides TaxID=37653 RepID=A0A0L8FTB8_OCTBM
MCMYVCIRAKYDTRKIWKLLHIMLLTKPELTFGRVMGNINQESPLQLRKITYLGRSFYLAFPGYKLSLKMVHRNLRTFLKLLQFFRCASKRTDIIFF